MMPVAELFRERSTMDGTFGTLILTVDAIVFECESLELPWKGNAPNISCIPTGNYECRWHHSPRFGMRYLVTDVPGRTGILIHPGNYAGDTDHGLSSDVEGCILLGLGRGVLRRQRAVVNSAEAVDRLQHLLMARTFRLTIQRKAG